MSMDFEQMAKMYGFLFVFGEKSEEGTYGFNL